MSNSEINEHVDIELPGLWHDLREDTNSMRREGFSVEDSNEPAIENVPAFNQESNTQECTHGNWTGSIVGVCTTKSSGRRKEKVGLIDEFADNNMSCFSRFSTIEWITHSIVLEVNNSIRSPLSLWESFAFIDVCLLMTINPGHKNLNFFLQNPQT